MLSLSRVMRKGKIRCEDVGRWKSVFPFPSDEKRKDLLYFAISVAKRIRLFVFILLSPTTRAARPVPKGAGSWKK